MTKRQKEIIGLILIVFSLISFISLIGHNYTENPYGLSNDSKTHNFLGIFGIVISHYYYLSLGYTSIIIPIIFSIIGYLFISDFKSKVKLKYNFYILFVGIFLSVFMSLMAYFTDNITISNNFSGFIGISIFNALNSLLGLFGSIIILLVVFILFITNILKISIYDLFFAILDRLKKYFQFLYFIITKIGTGFIKLIKKRKINDDGDINTDYLNKNNQDNSDVEIIDNYEEDVENDTNTENEVDTENNEKLKDVEDDENDDTNQELINEDQMIVEEETIIEEGDFNSEKTSISKYFNYKFTNCLWKYIIK